MRNTLNVDKWTTKKVNKALLSKKTDNGDKIRIPIFQRGLCWKRNDEIKLIDSLYNSYPIGSLLFYKKQGLPEYVLIDGLQRANTIKKFFKNKESFFDFNYLTKETNKKINTLEEEYSIYGFSENIKIIIKDYIKSNIKDSSFISNKIFDCYDNINPKHVIELSKSIVEDITDFLNIENYEVPIVIFECENNDVISEIFKRINHEGKKLSIFDIYAASWDKTKFSTNNEDIINLIVKRYDNYLNNGLEVDDYDKDIMLAEKKVNSFEYVFGLSRLLAKKYEELFCVTINNDDEVSQIAFDLLNICYGSKNKDMDSLDKVILSHKDYIDDIYNALDISCKYVMKIIKPYIYFKGNSHKKDKLILHSYWQVLSMIAFVYKNIYNIYDDYLMPDIESSFLRIKNNLRKHYVYDILNKDWREGNIDFAYKTIKDSRYDDILQKENFIAALDSHFEMQLNYRETQSANQVSHSDYIVLNTIYKKIFTAEEQLDDDYTFDVEHLCPKKQMFNCIHQLAGTKKPDSTYGLPVLSIANLCYLPSGINRSKKEKTIYQDKDIADKLLFIERNYSFTTYESLQFLDEHKTDFDDFKNKYITFLRERYLILRKMFIESLGYKILTSEEEKTIVNTEFDGMKVGKVAQEVFTKLFNKKMFSDNEINNLMDKDYCKNIFKLTKYPALSETKEFYSGKYRYYAEPFSYFGKKYYLTSEWYDVSRDLLIDYYFSFKK